MSTMQLAPEVRLALLVTGADLLRARFPKTLVTFTRGGDKYHARFDWPGIVTVTDYKTGAIAAMSCPGQPDTLADLGRGTPNPAEGTVWIR